MDNLGMWSILSVPIFFALTSQWTRRAKGILVWIFLWGQAGILAFSTWRLYHVWRAASAIDASYYHPQFPYAIFWASMLIVLLLILPVIWYCRDLRKAGGIDPPAEGAEKRFNKDAK